MIKLSAVGNQLSLVHPEPIVQGQAETVVAAVELSGHWEGYDVSVVWRGSGVEKSVPLIEGVCTVPWEVLTRSTALSVGVVGVRGAEILATPYVVVAQILPSPANVALYGTTSPTSSLVGLIEQMLGKATREAQENAQISAEAAERATQAKEGLETALTRAEAAAQSAAETESKYKDVMERAGTDIFLYYAGQLVPPEAEWVLPKGNIEVLGTRLPDSGYPQMGLGDEFWGGYAMGWLHPETNRLYLGYENGEYFNPAVGDGMFMMGDMLILNYHDNRYYRYSQSGSEGYANRLTRVNLGGTRYDLIDPADGVLYRVETSLLTWDGRHYVDVTQEQLLNELMDSVVEPKLDVINTAVQQTTEASEAAQQASAEAVTAAASAGQQKDDMQRLAEDVLAASDLITTELPQVFRSIATPVEWFNDAAEPGLSGKVFVVPLAGGVSLSPLIVDPSAGSGETEPEEPEPEDPEEEVEPDEPTSSAFLGVLCGWVSGMNSYSAYSDEALTQRIQIPGKYLLYTYNDGKYRVYNDGSVDFPLYISGTSYRTFVLPEEGKLYVTPDNKFWTWTGSEYRQLTLAELIRNYDTIWQLAELRQLVERLLEAMEEVV